MTTKKKTEPKLRWVPCMVDLRDGEGRLFGYASEDGYWATWPPSGLKLEGWEPTIEAAQLALLKAVRNG